MEAEDPWDWSVDRVVQELCTPNRTWEARSNVASMPDPAALENALREQEVTGSVLLTEVDDSVLRNDFGIKILGRRAFVREAISVLQSKSRKYMRETYHNGMAHSHHTPSVAGSPHPFPHYPFGPVMTYGQPRHFQLGAQGPIGLQNPLLQSPGDAIPPHQFLPIGQAPATLTTLGDDLIARDNFAISDIEGIKRRKRDFTTTVNSLALQPEDELPNQAALVGQTNILQDEDMQPMDPHTSPTLDSNGKKRKRIAPTLITSEINPSRNRELPTEADAVVHNVSPPVVEPGVVFIGEGGRKRIIPVHQQTSDSEDSYDYDGLVRRRRDTELQALEEGGQKLSNAAQDIVEFTIRQRTEASTESLENGYLGKKKMPVDNVFYGDTQIGDEIATVENIPDFFENQIISSGRRLYVNSLMKYFFNSKQDVFTRHGKSFTAVRPYPLKLAPTDHNPSFTLFTAGEAGRTIAKREGLRAWPEINPEAPSKVQMKADTESAGFNLDSSNSYEQCFDPETLLKWDAVPHGDEVLPLYGESDEENEFDVDTWKEIEDEQGTLEKLLLPLKKPILSAEQVNDAIDQGIAELVVKWNKYQLPKKQQKAFRIWKLTRHREARRAHIERIEQHLNRIIDDRIPKLRKEIASEVWSSQLQVLKQTRSMEHSIFDRETDRWEINVVQSRTRPEKPFPRTSSSKKSTTTIDDGLDGEALGSATVASSSDESLADFIVDDTQSDEEENELDLAESESDLEDTEASTPSKDIWRSQTRSKGFKEFIEGDNPSDSDEQLPNAHHDARMSGASTDGKLNSPQRASTSSTSPKSTPIKEERTLPKHSTYLWNGPIDLTMLSSDDSLATPPRKKKKKPLVTLFNRNSPFRSVTPPSKDLIILSDGDEPQTPDLENIPSLKDPAAVAKFSTQAWAKISDRKRLLITMLHGMVSTDRDLIFKYLTNLTKAELWNHMEEVMGALSDGANNVKGLDGEAYNTLNSLIWLFYCFVGCKERSNSSKILTKAIPKLKEAHDEYFPSFYRRCLQFGTYFKNKNPLRSLFGNDDDATEDEGPKSAKRRRTVNSSDNDDSGHDTPHSKRKKPIYEDAKARDLREQDKTRQREQAERRKTLHSRLAEFGTAASQHEIIINDSKFDDQGFICINDAIARRIKPHQVEGVRFMWNQIVTQDKELQGCLLAHTMGLGKTMQVITLLVAISESSRSTEASVYSQIPLPLRASKTLILCPPTLIDNWMDELLMWTADKDVLGEFRKVDSSLKPISKRLVSINAWYHYGGILVMGYDGFRMLIDNKISETRGQLLTAEQHNEVSKQLLEGPNIIVADEAHKMKNAKSAITKAAVRFRSQSRIALTGSPLANNVAEYHTMIDWVAPNYLGPALEFRAKYVEPIQQGLWHDSHPTERRKSLKMLGVLKIDLAPKVHRADMSVLRNDLPPKKEFVITVPLTDLQSKAYTIYVRSMTEKSSYAKTKDGEIASTTLWHWLAILSLLCNHPKCFDTKLKQRKEDARKELGANEAVLTSRDNTDQDDVLAEDLNVPVWKVGVSQELINEVANLFAAEAPSLEAINLSNKVEILCQILDASRAIGDKVLIFSQSLPTLNYLEQLCKAQNRVYARLDGKTKMDKRQELTRKFNSGVTELYLISTAAGGLGLNLPGANRVIIFDFKFNPIQEEQAVGRAYRIGQRKPVFVYRFVAGGTFESSVHNKTIFKMQLASRVVDKKNPIARASRKIGEFLFEPKPVKQMDLSEFEGMDPAVLDKILASQSTNPTIRGIVQSDTFERDDEDKLTSEEQKEVDQLLKDKQLERSNPKAYSAMLETRQRQSAPHQTPIPFPGRATTSSYANPYQPNPVQNLNQMPQNAAAGLGLPPKSYPAILPGAQVSRPVQQQDETNGSHDLHPPEGSVGGSLSISTPLSDASSSKKSKTDKTIISPSASPRETNARQTNGANSEKPVSAAKSVNSAVAPSIASGPKSKEAKADAPKAVDSSNNISAASATPLSNPEPLSKRQKGKEKVTGAGAVGGEISNDSDFSPSRGRSPLAAVKTMVGSVTPGSISSRDHRKDLLRRTKSVTPVGRLPPKAQSPSPSSFSTPKRRKPFSQPLFEVICESLFNTTSGSSESSQLPFTSENRNIASRLSAEIVKAFMKYLPDDKERNAALQSATTILASSSSKCRKLADGRLSFDKFARRIVELVASKHSTPVDGMKDIKNVCKASYQIPPFKKCENPAAAKVPSNNGSWPWQLLRPYQSRTPLERRFKTELQEFLQARGLNCDGSRAELLSRVQARRNKYPIY